MQINHKKERLIMKGFLLGALLLGVVAVVAYRVINKSSKKTVNEHGTASDTAPSVLKNNTELLPKQPNTTNYEDLSNQRTHTALNITERHEKAEVIISTALNNINSNDAEETVVVSENEADLNDILSDLDKL